jgi:hypothetical protein
MESAGGFQGLRCSFCFFRGPLCKMGGTAVFVSSSYIFGFVRVFVRIPYTVIQFSWISKKNNQVFFKIIVLK